LIFSVSPLIHGKLKKSTVQFHTSKNILKRIKQRNPGARKIAEVPFSGASFESQEPVLRAS
jgi:hypothetical protein